VSASPQSPGKADLPRVLVVTSRLDIGGTEQHLLRVLPRLRQRGLDVSLFVLERGGKLEQAILHAGVAISGPVRRLPRRLHAFHAGLCLRKQLTREEPDVLHFFLSEPYLVGSFAAFAKPNIQRVMSRRSLNVYQRRHPALAWLERRLHKHTAVLLGNSSAVVSDLLREGGDNTKMAWQPPRSSTRRCE
jgi:glycosyltransferase involved in cell wall biosynthesis